METRVANYVAVIFKFRLMAVAMYLSFNFYRGVGHGRYAASSDYMNIKRSVRLGNACSRYASL